MAKIQVTMEMPVETDEESLRRAAIIGQVDGIGMAMAFRFGDQPVVVIRTIVNADSPGEAAVMVGDMIRTALGAKTAQIGEIHIRRL